MFEDIKDAIQAKLDEVLGVPPSRQHTRQHNGDYFLLVGEEVVPTDCMTWGIWFQKNDKSRVIGAEDVGDAWVSTVFIGMNHNYRGDRKIRPLIFETMIFGGAYSDYQWRYSTLQEAREGHNKVVASLYLGLEPDL